MEHHLSVQSEERLKKGAGVQEWRKEISNKLWDKDEKNQVTAYKKDQC